MPIIVTIIKSPDSVNISESTKTFDEQGGSLGRGKSNAWVLDDPERFLSSCHCEISSEGGQFYITDLSTNGTFFDGSVNPMGKGTKLALNDGSGFVLGDYEFSVSINMPQNMSPQNTSDPFATNSMSATDIFAAPMPGSDFGGSGDSPFGGGHVSSSESLFSTSAEETDPLAALDKAQGGSQNNALNDPLGFSSNTDAGNGFSGSDPFQSPPSSDPFAGPSHSDQANPLNQQVSWPESQPDQSLGGIPDDWDDDLMSSAPPAPAQAAPTIAPAAAPTPQPGGSAQTPQPAQAPVKPAQAPVSQADNAAILAQQQANEKIQQELEILKQHIHSQQGGGAKADVNVDTHLIEAMGLQNRNLVDAEITQINQVVGEVVREMVSGLMQVLGSRSSIKNEFRMNVTTIQPVENNPLKFSANVDDALENMFIKQGNAYKKPVEAVKESFEGIAEHQVAILAGIRAAFKGIIERFDPNLLEQRFAKHKKTSIIPVSQNAKNWEQYLEYYSELAGDIDNSFQYLFGDEFVQAYEEQLQQLTIARKAKKNNTNNHS